MDVHRSGTEHASCKKKAVVVAIIAVNSSSVSVLFKAAHTQVNPDNNDNCHG